MEDWSIELKEGEGEDKLQFLFLPPILTLRPHFLPYFILFNVVTVFPCKDD